MPDSLAKGQHCPAPSCLCRPQGPLSCWGQDGGCAPLLVRTGPPRGAAQAPRCTDAAPDDSHQAATQDGCDPLTIPVIPQPCNSRRDDMSPGHPTAAWGCCTGPGRHTNPDSGGWRHAGVAWKGPGIGAPGRGAGAAGRPGSPAYWASRTTAGQPQTVPRASLPGKAPQDSSNPALCSPHQGAPGQQHPLPQTYPQN